MEKSIWMHILMIFFKYKTTIFCYYSTIWIVLIQSTIKCHSEFQCREEAGRDL